MVSRAQAGDELYLRWDDCLADAGVYNKVFACDTNTGVDVLVGSFRLEETTPEFTGIAATLYLEPLSSLVPDWWSLQSGGCRAGSLTVSFAPPLTSTHCENTWGGRTIGGGTAFVNNFYNGLIRVGVAVQAGQQFTLPGGQELFAFALQINHARTTGLSTCAGCATPVCIGWGDGLFTRTPGSGYSNRYIYGAMTPMNGSNVTWQPGAVATTHVVCSPTRGCNASVSCQSVTPARTPTWGSIKSLYR